MLDLESRTVAIDSRAAFCSSMLGTNWKRNASRLLSDSSQIHVLLPQASLLDEVNEDSIRID